VAEWLEHSSLVWEFSKPLFVYPAVNGYTTLLRDAEGEGGEEEPLPVQIGHWNKIFLH